MDYISRHLPRRFFVTGTDTNTGKTFVSAMLMLGLKSHYWKPIQSGIAEGSDTDWIRKITELPDEYFFKERYLLNEPLSPHAAALIDGVKIELNAITAPGPSDQSLIIEGAGGVMVPINDQHMMLDVIKKLALPAILVCRSGLGTINHSLLTINCLRQAGVGIAGVIMNGPLNESNRAAIENYGQVPVLAEIEPIENVSRRSLLEIFEHNFGVKQ
ncbi:MAG: dethiobiotin synthase [Candidatus Obscuribacterales bacterium]|nr:dethiobiotin synthase [Candidatus Obscuribacterales bacterium]